LATGPLLSEPEASAKQLRSRVGLERRHSVEHGYCRPVTNDKHTVTWEQIMSHLDAAPSESGEFLEKMRQGQARQPYPKPTGRFQPRSLTVAVSREAGSRGGTIARRAGRKLGWQVYNQELLEYLAHEKHLNRDLFHMLEQPALDWVEEQLLVLLQRQSFAQHKSLVELARVVLAIGARGEAVILGRGAGCILPAPSTLHVRVIGPLRERIAYMSQLERLSRDQAEAQVHKRDQLRADFIATHFNRQPADVYQYDLVLNSTQLGEDLCAELISRATHGKLTALVNR
jgi:cytidylate kinase